MHPIMRHSSEGEDGLGEHVAVQVGNASVEQEGNDRGQAEEGRPKGAVEAPAEENEGCSGDDELDLGDGVRRAEQRVDRPKEHRVAGGAVAAELEIAVAVGEEDQRLRPVNRDVPECEQPEEQGGRGFRNAYVLAT